MTIIKEKKINLIILIVFAALLSATLFGSLHVGESGEVASAAELSGELSAPVTLEDASNGFDFSYEENDEEFAADEMVPFESIDSIEVKTYFTVFPYENAVTMYASDTVNVRCGAGTDYDKVGKVSWGTPVTVTGVTDNGWYQVLYKEQTAYIIGDYIVAEIPGIPYLFVGDSRTVQLQMAVGSSDKAYIAKVGEGYNYFRDVAIPSITQYAGQGTVMIINFGVNDLSNAKKYVKLVNSNVDAWVNAGITVYYASVTPVGSGASVTNAQIESFNATLQAGLDPRVNWIDTYSYLKQVGFSSKDGLHYNRETYKNLYAYYTSVVNQ